MARLRRKQPFAWLRLEPVDPILKYGSAGFRKCRQSTDGPRRKRKSGSRDRGKEVVRRFDQLLRFRLVDRLVVEGGTFEYVDHLTGYLLTLGGDRLDLRFEDRICGIVARERSR